ncbi:MAG: phytanoyl-CoA dioxygenase family protein [Rivularia sp. (in: Bacteria)]|nr:phytanoyl-CoA dioxygenase family protein [Rivularia sp. MS3]
MLNQSCSKKIIWLKIFNIKININKRILPYYKRARKNPLWLLMYISGRFLIFRSLAKLLFGKPFKQKFDVSSSIFQAVDTEFITQKLKNNGSWAGLKLPLHIQKQILKFAISTECYADSHPHLGFKIFQKEQAEKRCQFFFNQAQYFNVARTCPTIKKLASDSILLEIASKYLGTKPTFTGTRLWWIFPVNEASYNPMRIASYFHYDVDDYNSLRFFFYLTDVNVNSGPHIYVRGSHRNKSFTNLISPFKQCSDEEIANYYGEENIVSICGEAGFGFAEDTFCYHKAARPKSRSRLILQLQYAMNDYGVHNDIVDDEKLRNIINN